MTRGKKKPQSCSACGRATRGHDGPFGPGKCQQVMSTSRVEAMPAEDAVKSVDEEIGRLSLDISYRADDENDVEYNYNRGSWAICLGI